MQGSLHEITAHVLPLTSPDPAVLGLADCAQQILWRRPTPEGKKWR
jgi:hypothetical protein